MGLLDKQISRKEFLKKTAIGAATLTILGRSGLAEDLLSARAQAAGNTGEAGGMTFSDNLKSGVVISANPPASTRNLWIDTGNGGITKYYDGAAWVPTRAVWG